MSRAHGQRSQRRRSAGEWQELIARFERSGQTRKTFCGAEKLAPSTFDLWRGKVREQQRTVGNEEEAIFVELSGAQETTACSTSWEVELDLGAGVVLRVRTEGRFDVEHDVARSDLAVHCAHRYALFI